MHFYCLSKNIGNGNYEFILMHEKKFTNKEFINMYNSVLSELNEKERESIVIIGKIICDKYGFKEVETEIVIGIKYNDKAREIPDKFIKEDKFYFEYDGYNCFYNSPFYF